MEEVTDRTSLFKQDSRLVIGGFLWYEWINKTGVFGLACRQIKGPLISHG
jgi:hypothetical protein